MVSLGTRLLIVSTSPRNTSDVAARSCLTEPYKINAHLVSPHLANQVRQPQPHLDLLAHTEDG